MGRWLPRILMLALMLAALAVPNPARAQDDVWLASARGALEASGRTLVERGFWMDPALVSARLGLDQKGFFSTVLAAGEYHILGVCEGCDDFALIATDGPTTLGTSQLVTDPAVAFVLAQPARVQLEIWMEGCFNGGQPCRYALATFMKVEGGPRRGDVSTRGSR